MTDFWADAEVISGYSRAQAIEDGALVAIDRDTFDGARIFKDPVAFTSALWAECERGQGSDPKILTARVYDVCVMATMPTARVEGCDSFYPVTVGAKALLLRCNRGPGDDPAPVMTIGFPTDF